MSAQKKLKSKVCLVGEVAVGKTSLISRYVLSTFDDRYIMTMGTKVSKKVVGLENVGKTDVTLEMTIWDIMGEKGFRQLLKEAYFYGAQGILAVCDVTRPSTLGDLDDWIDHVIKVVGEVPIYICGNKADLRESAKVDEDAVRAFAKAYSAPFGFTSAKTGAGVEAAFHAIARKMAVAQLKT